MATPRVPNWQALILRGVGAPVTPENVRFMNAWAQAEGGNASNNPFNTTEPGYGTVGNYNSVGVKNYSSPMGGIQATIATLKNGHYAPILSALSRGNSAMADAQAEAQTPWGTGSLIEKVLGGKVTGGGPTSGVPSASPGANTAAGLAQAMNTGAIAQPTQDPTQGLIGLVLANNQALMQRQTSGYQPF